jgi:CheY-like chemotaxis protein
LLELMGHTVWAARDGAEAFALAEVHRPELVLLDLGMPRMDGHEVARRMRSSPWGEKIRIVALSGFGDGSDRARSLAAGCDDHLVKPVSPAQLEAALA